jgi:RecA-family ATPase
MDVALSDTNTVLDAALEVGMMYPVFPTSNKRPCWSNDQLGVKTGNGGFKIASQDPARIRELFAHQYAEEVSVPTGEVSGILCIDIDLYKGDHVVKWHEENRHWLEKTLCHQSSRGGLHYIFNWPDGVRFPATLTEGVDVKGHGGFIVFPPSGGYTVLKDNLRQDFPLEQLEKAMRAKGGTGSVTGGSAYNEASDDELVSQIQNATELYPALRTLSYRMASRREDPEHIIAGLEHVMDSSVAADAGHPRHDDWLDRKSKIEDLVDSAIKKHNRPVMSKEAAAMLTEGKSFIDTEKMIAAATRPVGPQRETKAEDIEAIVGDVEANFKTFDAKTLSDLTLKPIRWTVPGMIPERGTVSLGGTSNVGKTRWLAALTALGAAGKTDLMGLPEAPAFSVLWLANEERVEDIMRRIKATFRQHCIETSERISVRGKDQGMLRLVAVNENGNPEIDEANIAIVITEARRIKAKMIIFDPYVTLSDAMDENSATSAAMLTKAFLLITELTGAAVLHAHHTPKDRTKDNDWYRGDSGAWRGSGAIYSALDCGYTLAHWMPKVRDPRKSWKQHYLDQNLSRWIVLDTGKIREGKSPPPIVYELVGQEMAEGEGDAIGVCRLSSENEANAVLMENAAESISKLTIIDALIDTMGIGTFTTKEIVDRMHGVPGWSVKNKDNKVRGELGRICEMLAKPEQRGDLELQFISSGTGTGKRWKLVIGSIHDEEE